MTARSKLKHRATVTRREDTDSSDDLGEPIVTDIPVYASLPCRIISEEGQLLVVSNEIVNISRHTMYAPRGTDLQEETDTISQVTDKRGNKIFGDSRFRVESVFTSNPKIVIANLEIVQ